MFVHFAGCNVWSGKNRERQKASRFGVCALWCDANFKGTGGRRGGEYSAMDLADLVREVWLDGIHPHHRDLRQSLVNRTVVLTGGEPSTQIDQDLCLELHRHGFNIHVETNGAMRLPEDEEGIDGVDWITLSPKPPLEPCGQTCDELKCIVPDVDPNAYVHLVREGQHGEIFVQPCDYRLSHPESFEMMNRAATQHAVSFCMVNPWASLTVQQNKLIGLR